MWITEKNFPNKGFLTPPPTWKTRPASPSPLSERKHRSPSSCKPDLFHVMHKVPAGDSPYVRAKHVQLIDKEPSKAISLFWAAINSGDRVDSALKDMAVVMKQLNRSEEAIEAIKSFRHLCPLESQESLDNLLVELYKRSGRIEDEIEMLQRKLKRIEDNMAFGGKRTKTARSQGKKIQITVDQERSRILGNLAWAYLQQYNYGTAEELYKKALALEPDNNKQCNLAICLMNMNRLREAKYMLQTIKPSCKDGHLDDSFAKSYERALQMLSELELSAVPNSNEPGEDHYKNHRSVASPINRNSKETTAFTSQSRDYDRCFVISGSSPDGYKDTFSGRDEGNSKYISFGTVSMPHSSPQTSFYNDGKEGGGAECFENSFGRRPDFSSRRKENWVGMTGTSVGSSAQKKGYISPSPVRAIPKIPLAQPRTGPWFLNKEDDRRRGLWGDDAAGASSHKPSFEHGEAQRQIVHMESRRVVGNERMEIFVGKDGEYSSDATPSCSMGVKDTEKECLGKNSFGIPPLVSQNPMPNLCRKMSWADMAEEEEHKLLSGIMETAENKCFDGQGSREGFYDENLNSNIICPTPPNHMENLNKNLESCDLKDEYLKSGNDVSSRNPIVRRSLCFDQKQNPDPVEYCCSSPLPKKALDFEGDSFAPADETREFSLGKYTPPMRRNRLQVFQNITLLPDSP